MRKKFLQWGIVIALAAIIITPVMAWTPVGGWDNWRKALNSGAFSAAVTSLTASGTVTFTGLTASLPISTNASKQLETLSATNFRSLIGLGAMSTGAYPSSGIPLSTGSGWGSSISGLSSQFVKGDGSLDSSTYLTAEAMQDNLGGTTGGDGFLRSSDGHLTYTYNDAANTLTLTVIPTITKYPTYIEFGGTTTQQYDVSGNTYVSSVTQGSANGNGQWGGATPGIPDDGSSGHTLANCLSATNTTFDNTYLEVQELSGSASATNPLSVQFIFTSITDFSTIATRSYYIGSASHNMAIQLWNWGTSAWDTYATFSGESGYVQRSLAVFNSTAYIGTGGNSGKVILQFIHTSSGNASHLIRFDYVALVDGGQGGGSPSIASAISNTPAGTITATNVQTALNQLDTLKLPLAGGTMSGAITFDSGQTWPTFNQNTTGTAAGLTAQYIDWSSGSGGNSIANKPTLGAMASGGYPGAGVPNSTGSAWGTSYTVGTSANNLVQLDGSAKLPAVDGSQLTNVSAGNAILGSSSSHQLRSLALYIADGTNADTIKCRLSVDYGYNNSGLGLSFEDNLGKSGSTTNFSLSADGSTLTVTVPSKTVSGTILSWSTIYDSSGLSYTGITPSNSTGKIVLQFVNSSGGAVDLTTITSSKETDLLLTFITTN